MLVGLGYMGLVWWLDRYEKEPLWLLGLVFGWGLLGASALAYVFESLIFALFNVPDWVLTLIVAPVQEEALKCLAPLFVVFLSREMDDPLDGFVYGAAAGLGFGLAENILYVLGSSHPLSLFFVRSVLFGAMHGLFTGVFGLAAGYAKARGSAGKFLALGFLGAVGAHAVHNLFAQLGAVGWGLRFYLIAGFALLSAVFGLLARERRVLTRYLKPELEAGRITEEEYALALSGKLGLLADEFSKRRQLKSLLAKLAFRLREFEEKGDARALEEAERLRERIRELRR